MNQALFDDDLLAGLKNDSPDAYNEIFDRYWNKLLAIAFNRLKNIADAEDVVQDVFVSLWKRRHEQSIVNLSHYLYAAVRYAVIRQMKSSVNTIQMSNIEELLIIDGLQIAERLDYQILKIYLEREIEKLPKKCKIIFLHSREDALSNKKIAEKLNISEKAVEAQITRALKRLRIALRMKILLLFLNTFF